MTSFPLRRTLAAVLLLSVLGVGVAVWLRGGDYARRRVAQLVRHALTHNSELVLAPFEVQLSPWRDFPHLTASIRHLSLTDTAYGRRVPVLRVGRADLRLELTNLLHGRVRATRLVVEDVDFQEQTDSLGRSWGLRGKRRKGTAPPPALTQDLDLDLDELLVRNFRLRTQNGYSRSAFGVQVREARLRAGLRAGVLRVAGTLDGQLSYLRTRTGTLFEREPVRAWVHYTYTFARREGHLWHTRALLNGDTIRVRGTHTVDPRQPAGTLLRLKFVGNQPLTEVLRAALPPRLEPYLAGATSPSTAHIHYTITGLSGPTVSPRNVLTFGLRAASLRWPDPTRHINRWDLQGTYDNGPAHGPTSTMLTLTRCRIYSSAGRLDAALTLRDFTRPYLRAHLRGRAELAELAALLAPGRWRARHGLADLDVRLHGLLPPRAGRPNFGRMQRSLSLRGALTLRNASFLLPVRGADVSELNVRVGLRDSLCQLSQAAGVLNGMRFRATATTTYLYDYLTGQHDSARINGQFAVEELRLAVLRALMRPGPRAAPAGAALELARPGRRPRDRAQLAATLGRELIPPGLLLDVGLHCRRLLLATDTLHNLAVTVRHDGHRVQLQHLAGRVWGGEVRGDLAWPTDSADPVALVHYRLGVHFAALDYRQLLARLARPLPDPAARAARRARGGGAAGLAVRDLLLAANGALTVDIDRVQLPNDQALSEVALRLEKTGSVLHVPFLRFRTPEGGRGEASATAQINQRRLVAADADVTLRYSTLDVQRLLGLIASLTAPSAADSVPTARMEARSARRASRRALRLQAPDDRSLFSNGVLSAVLRVEADEVRYGALRGRRLQLVSRLLDGEARLTDAALDAWQGHLSLRGRMQTTADRRHHPTEARLRLDGVQLPDLLAAAASLGLNVPGEANVRGTLHGVATLRTDLDSTFLPRLPQTTAYLKTDIDHLELLNVEALMAALKPLRAARTAHLYFEPVRSEFLLSQGQLLIPGLRLNSNLSNLEVSGRYGLDGRTDLFVGLKPLQALFGNNDKRIERIAQGAPVTRGKGTLTYLHLRRAGPTERYQVRLFQKDEQRRAQATLREQCRALLITQRLDTTGR